jgi:predicted lipid-binding transport protein (Tim44 family)
MAERQDANALRMAKLEADAAKKAGKSAMMGNIIGGIGGGLTKLFTGGIG